MSVRLRSASWTRPRSSRALRSGGGRYRPAFAGGGLEGLGRGGLVAVAAATPIWPASVTMPLRGSPGRRRRALTIVRVLRSSDSTSLAPGVAGYEFRAFGEGWRRYRDLVRAAGAGSWGGRWDASGCKRGQASRQGCCPAVGGAIWCSGDLISFMVRWESSLSTPGTSPSWVETKVS